MTVRIAGDKRDNGEEQLFCEASQILFPQTSQAWSTAVFNNPPIRYAVTVTAGDVDVAQMTVEVASKVR